MTEYRKAKSWKGNDLKGSWHFTIKVDGVRAFWKDNTWVSRADKPLYNIPNPTSLDFEVTTQGVEVYCSRPGQSSKENYKTTIQNVRTKNKEMVVLPRELYSLDPLDPRLTPKASWFTDPTADTIKHELHLALLAGFEGLIIRQDDKWLKVKPYETYDVLVTGVIEGTGKHKGRMGALQTAMGKVGTGFTDEDREHFWDLDWNRNPDGTFKPVMIEVSCMQLTPDGKFRHPAFERIRYDK